MFEFQEYQIENLVDSGDCCDEIMIINKCTNELLPRLVSASNKMISLNFHAGIGQVMRAECDHIRELSLELYDRVSTSQAILNRTILQTPDLLD